MGTTRIEPGPVSDQVRRNIRELRECRGMSLRALSERMGELGRPLRVPVLFRIEQGERRVDVDDLVAFAAALNCPPNRLLLPGNTDEWESGSRYAPTSTIEVSPAGAWWWALGYGPLCADDDRANLTARRMIDYEDEEPAGRHAWRGARPVDYVWQDTGDGRVRLRFARPDVGPGSLKVRGEPLVEAQPTTTEGDAR